MTLTGYSALGDSTFIPLIQVDDTWQVNAIVTKIFGEHNIRIGAGYIARKFTVFQSASPVGNFTFNTQLTDNGAGSGGNAIASFLLGYPSQVARSHSLIYPHYHTNEPNVVRAGRLACDVVADAQPRRAIRRVHAADGGSQSAGELRSGDRQDSGRGTERRQRRAPTSRPTTPTSRPDWDSPPRCPRASSSAVATGWRTSRATCSQGRS